MDARPTAQILRVFHTLPDPRAHNTRHGLGDVLTIALMAVVCGADGWVDVAVWGEAKKQWLKTFLELPSDIPSHDTFGRIFGLLDPDAMERAFRDWIATLVKLGGGALVAMDGKSLRRSFAKGWDKSGMAHMVSAFVQANSTVFAQIKSDGPGMELNAIEKLLGLLDLKDCVVSIDAMGCQKSTAQKILDAGGGYVLQVKKNQQALFDKLQSLLGDARLSKMKGFKGQTHRSVDGDHGRIETRSIWVLWDVGDLGAMAGQWPGLKSAALVECQREVGNKTSKELHYYISTLAEDCGASRFLSYIRGHWSIENNLHWCLDMAFDEDQRRIRIGHGAENYSRLCRMALNMLKRETTKKMGIAAKRKACGWEDAYLLKVLAAGC
jgi:predicted transposase YbfD/YdcC